MRNSGHKLSIEVEAQPVPQETTKSHKNHAKSAGRVKQRQREGTEPNKGTVTERKRAESSRLPMNELLTGTLEHHQPQYEPYRSERRHGRGDTGKAEKTDEQRIPQRKQVGAGQSSFKTNRRAIACCSIQWWATFSFRNCQGRTRKGQVLNSPWFEGCYEVVDNDVVMLQVNQHGLRPRSKPRGQDERKPRLGPLRQPWRTK